MSTSRLVVVTMHDDEREAIDHMFGRYSTREYIAFICTYTGIPLNVEHEWARTLGTIEALPEVTT